MEKYSSDLRAQLMDRETSIRTEIPCTGGGTVVTLGFPGLAFDVRGDSYIDKERMAATLSHQALAACRLLIVLVELEEVPPLAWSLLSDIAQERSLQVLHMPIGDYQAPDADFMEKWSAMERQIRAILDAGATVALSCHYGAGRSGTIAAALLMERGLDMQSAIELVRSKFADSIESERQIEWLHEREALHRSTPERSADLPERSADLQECSGRRIRWVWTCPEKVESEGFFRRSA